MTVPGGADAGPTSYLESDPLSGSKFEMQTYIYPKPFVNREMM